MVPMNVAFLRAKNPNERVTVLTSGRGGDIPNFQPICRNCYAARKFGMSPSKQTLQPWDGVTMNHTMETNRESDAIADSNQNPRLGILVLNYNGQKWLSPLFRSIQSNGYPNVRVYLVDNASEDDSIRETLRRLGKNCLYNFSIVFSGPRS